MKSLNMYCVSGFYSSCGCVCLSSSRLGAPCEEISEMPPFFVEVTVSGEL